MLIDECIEDGDAFAVPDLWKKSTLAHFDEESTNPLIVDFEPLDTQGQTFGISNDLAIQLPDLSTFTYGPVEDIEALDSSSVPSSVDSNEFPAVLETDIWSFPRNEGEERRPTTVHSWEAFYDKDFRELRTVYLSEAGPQVFDAALAADIGITEDPSRSPGRIVQFDPLLKCLLQLGLGRESILYSYSHEEQSFRPFIEDGRMSGYSLELFGSLSSTFIEYGNQTRQLRSFIDEIHLSTSAFPALVALTGCFASILASLHAQIEDDKKTVRSLLQLQLLFQGPGQILVLLSQIRCLAEGANTDEELISRLYVMAENSEHTAAWLQPTIFTMLSSVSNPWLESVSSWLGFIVNPASSAHEQKPRFATVSEGSGKLESGKENGGIEYEFEPLAMPKFIAEEDARLIFNTGQTLRLLEVHKPEHPLANPNFTNLNEDPRLRWHFSWEHIEKIQTYAKEYESKLQAAIRDFDIRGEYSNQPMLFLEDHRSHFDESATLSEESAKAYIANSITVFEQPLPTVTAQDLVEASGLRGTRDFGETQEKEIVVPPVSLLPTLSFNPLILTQAHLVNRACLRLLFREHNIRSHFSLLHRYSLFGDGVFASRLSHALFDPELQPSERRKGHSRYGTSGLKLGSRDTWPPAGSELRLALMGILTESYYNGDQASSMFRAELPGGLSFSIRQMSEDELQRCMNPNSIEALDFLRLQYQPTPPLDVIITDASLSKYDAVFRLLLRAIRMLFVVNQLFREANKSARHADFISQRFRIESHHFVSAVCGYFFDRVQVNWGILDQRLKDVDDALDQDGTESLADLRDFHEEVLNRMMFALILRKRQVQVMKLLEEIFSMILQFTREYRNRAEAESSSLDVQEIYEKFKKKVRVFISVCRGLSERRGQGGINTEATKADSYINENTSDDGGNTIGQLLLRFEMSGFYAR